MWFLKARNAGKPKLRLFCFPNAGVGPSAFRGWAEQLGSEIEFTGIQLPGREGRFRERPYQEFQVLIQDLTDAMTPQLDLPFAFFGHSLGAFLAFETAHAVREATGKTALHLFASACRAPSVPSPHPEIRDLPDTEFIESLNRMFGRGIPDAILQDREYLAALLPALRADVHLFERYCYTPRQPLDCAISVFGGVRDKAVHVSGLSEWQLHTSRRFEARLLDAEHFYLQSERNALTSHVRQTLHAALA